MLRFFSKIRYQLVAQNQMAKYLRYAIGEILLVVIGILIALQINNWNAYKKDRQLEKNYLESFLEELDADSTRLNYFESRYPEKIEGLQLAKNYILYGIEISDTAGFVDKVSIGGLASRTSLFENKSTYEDIISTGNIRLIQNKKLKREILDYYQLVENTQIYLGNLRSEYATYTNSLRPYDASDTFQPDAIEYKHIFANLKKDMFLGLANEELAFAFALKVRINRMDKYNKSLKESIISELQRLY